MCENKHSGVTKDQWIIILLFIQQIIDRLLLVCQRLKRPEIHHWLEQCMPFHSWEGQRLWGRTKKAQEIESQTIALDVLTRERLCNMILEPRPTRSKRGTTCQADRSVTYKPWGGMCLGRGRRWDILKWHHKNILGPYSPSKDIRSSSLCIRDTRWFEAVTWSDFCISAVLPSLLVWDKGVVGGKVRSWVDADAMTPKEEGIFLQD